jgi:hypothetical protein
MAACGKGPVGIPIPFHSRIILRCGPMTTRVPTQSPSSSPPEEEIDLEEIEDAVRRLEAVPYALWSPGMRAQFDLLVEQSARMLLDLHDRGLIRFGRTADGRLDAVLLERVRH